MPPVVKMVYVFAGGNFMTVECIAYVMRRGSCKRCGGITTAAAPAIPGTSFGPGVLGFIEEYYSGRCTHRTISYFFEVLYGFAISQNAVWNARKAIRDLLEGTYKEILDHIAEAPFVHMDESPIRMNGRQGYVWLATIWDATYIVAAPSRAAAVLDMHFGRILGVPVVSDGYVVCNMLSIRQRCWVHLLCEAEEYAIRNGKSDISCHCRLLSVYRSIKGRESAGSSECISPERAVLEIAASYPEGPKFRIKLEGAAPTCSPSSDTRACRPTTTAPSWRYATPPSCTGTCATSYPRRREGRSSRCWSPWRVPATSWASFRGPRWNV